MERISNKINYLDLSGIASIAILVLLLIRSAG